MEDTHKVARMEELRQIAGGLNAELERISEAKMYIENLISQIRGQCISIMESMDLEGQEKKYSLKSSPRGGKAA